MVYTITMVYGNTFIKNKLVILSTHLCGGVPSGHQSCLSDVVGTQRWWYVRHW